MNDVQRFEIRYDRWCGWLLGMLGMGRRFSRVEVAADHVTVVMGWAFRSEIPRTAMASAGPGTARVLGWGVHGWRGSWLVNGSSHGLVELRIDPPVRSRVIGVPVRLRRLWLSLDEPEAFVRAVDPAPAATH